MNETRGLWRGKRIDEKKWTYGYLISPGVDGKVAYIGYLVATDDHGFTIASVDPQTLGECTNIYDNAKKLIFEGDIVKDCMDQVYEVKFSVDRGGFFPFACGDGCGCCEHQTIHADCGEAYIIGNIHDNPELLEQ